MGGGWRRKLLKFCGRAGNDQRVCAGAGFYSFQRLAKGLGCQVRQGVALSIGAHHANQALHLRAGHLGAAQADGQHNLGKGLGVLQHNAHQLRLALAFTVQLAVQAAGLPPAQQRHNHGDDLQNAGKVAQNLGWIHEVCLFGAAQAAALARGLQVDDFRQLVGRADAIGDGSQADDGGEVSHASVQFCQQAGGNGAVPGQVDEQRGGLPVCAAQGNAMHKRLCLFGIALGGVKLGGDVGHLQRPEGRKRRPRQLFHLRGRERVGKV